MKDSPTKADGSKSNNAGVSEQWLSAFLIHSDLKFMLFLVQIMLSSSCLLKL